MHYLTLSFTHKNTSIEVREKLSFGSINSLRNILDEICSHHYINEAIVLSTCNRVEIITSVSKIDSPLSYILSQLSIASDVPQDELESRVDIYEDSGAVHHLFAVVSSLDSLVVGETQIAGQLKNAFKFAYDEGYCSQKLSRLVHRAFKCSGRIREQTDISKSPISVASVAVAKAKEMLGNLGGMSAVVVGAGEMSTLVAKHLVANEVNTIILSRNKQKAINLANELGEFAVGEGIEKLKEYINRYRLIFSATSANGAVIKEDMIKMHEFDRYFFDIAVPRDIELNSSSHIHVFAVDDLQEIVMKNMALREEQAGIAYKIVREETIEFYKWLQSLAIEPIIKEIRLKAKDCAKEQIKKALKKGYIKNSDQKEVEKIINQVFNVFLHKPTANIRAMSKLPECDTLIQSISYFFDINEEQAKYINHYKCEYNMEKKI